MRKRENKREKENERVREFEELEGGKDGKRLETV